MIDGDARGEADEEAAAAVSAADDPAGGGDAATLEAVLELWFGDAPDGRRDRPRSRRWFRGGGALDARIAERFTDTVARAAAGELERWRAAPEGTLALICLLDQFPRHIWRGTARAFAHDARALAIAEDGIRREQDRTLPLVQRVFFYLPFEHDESLASQERSVELFGALAREAPPELAVFAARTLASAEEHRSLIARFGRFPHRDAALGRATGDAEALWLARSGRRFGQ